jgi:hypothetical protein
MTSATDILVEGPFDLMVEGEAYTFFYRYINNQAIINIQRNFLNELADQNSKLFLKYLR